MYASLSLKNIAVIICFLFIAVGMRAQSAPTFTFGQPTAITSQPGKFLAVDINNDGFVDVVSIEANPSGASVMIYLNNGDGTFRAPFSVFDGPIADIAIADFDGDGNLDIAVSENFDQLNNGGHAEVIFIYGNGQGGFSGGLSFQVDGTALDAGDFNNDGKPDLAVLGQVTRTITILTNIDGQNFNANTFSVPTHYDTVNPGSLPDFLTAIVAGDFNGDGKIDLVYQDACGDNNACFVQLESYFLLTNTRAGFTPTQITLETSGAGPLQSADIDGDGRSDFYFSFLGCREPCGGIDVMYGNADGTFQGVGVVNLPDGQGNFPHGVVAGDFNNDGIMDFAAAVDENFPVNPGVNIYLGKGGRGGFTDPVHFDSPNGATSLVAAGFVNHDGQKDILLTDGGDFIPLLNTTGFAQDPCPFSADPGINFCLPAAGGTAVAPVHFVGSFHAQTQPANRIELWVDGKKQLQTSNDRIDTRLALPTGTHSATLVGVSANGLFVKSAVHSFTVQSECPLPSTAKVSICSPASGTKVDSPVHIAASATAPSGRTIATMRIYIDNVAQLTVSANNIAADLTVSLGSHTLAVVAWDNTGVSEKTTETFTVTGPCLPSGPGVKICSPVSGATVTSPVDVSAGAIPTAQRITAIRVYLDNVAIFFSSNNGAANSFSIEQRLTMAAGTHHLVTVAYQDDGTALTAGETITVH